MGLLTRDRRYVLVIRYNQPLLLEDFSPLEARRAQKKHLKSCQIMKIAPHLRAVGAPKAPVDQHIKVVGKHVQHAAL